MESRWRVLVIKYLAYHDEVKPHDDTTANTSKGLGCLEQKPLVM